MPVLDSILQHPSGMRVRAVSRRLISVACAAALIPVAANATPYACLGKVEQVTVDLSGQVNVSFVFETGSMAFETACGVDAVINGIPVAACKSMLALFVTARTTQQNIQMWFDNATPGNCAAPSWSNLKNMGWYWGPSLRQ